MERILLVEDDGTIVATLSQFLRSEGFFVQTAPGQTQALAALDGAEFDLVLLDVGLKDGNGFSVCSAVKQRTRSAVIFLSASGDEYSVVTGLDLGADDYLAKPFSITELVARVQALLRRASATPEATALREADLEVDVVTHRVTRAGRRNDLQPLEYQLLEYLMRNKGRVVSKTTIMERVWDYAFDPHTNVVEVRVSRLRSKITAPGERELIHTIRRFGYVLEAR